MTTTTATLSLLVFHGSPLDFIKYRHAVLLLTTYPDNQQSMFHITGPPGEFKFVEVTGANPTQSAKLERNIPVVTTMVRDACARVKVRNDLPGWNCQNWVGEALSELVKIGCCTEVQRGLAVDGMVDACLEARDERFA
ncbi:hypothetical protein BO83DRAFT_431927 [Aspergillus eucalypticola CBS 122712]|uniref:Uncharacterized protein n=1 Tax=Aspergillus eucalypticola (strain CBS 122712 / IBT 29274) TaxID=1448314 RepID=A0A317UPV3_ASPEC|nr:uncharacterized protein BO83DRAFT_431927 [Aspergillus eucalypticola CBS 122712]PWY63246.1 hypothetical protein BO83DRAFT_431927 [Aspergillus eucalypticola CBS 122712]